MQLSLSLFGTFQATWAGQSISFPTNATRALLAYLALEAGRPHTREQLASLLWPEQPQAAAYANLRQTLARLRKAFPEASATAAFLEVSPHALRFVGERADIDVVAFQALLAACAAHAHADTATCPECIERLERAVALYRGELLQGMFLEQSQPFEEWLLVLRENLHRQVLHALQSLSAHYEALGQFEPMRQAAQRQIALEPWREEAYAQVMRALAWDGQRTAALAQFDACRRVLDAELGVEPSPELFDLYRQIQAGTLQPAAPPPAAPANHRAAQPIAHGRSAEAPLPHVSLIGREQAVATVYTLLQRPDVRIATLIGPGGVGKTGIALRVAADIQQSQADQQVVFVALAASSNAELVVKQIAQALDVRETAEQPLLERVQENMCDRRLLLLLDNFEQVLDAAPLVAGLLAACSDLQVLITSRVALRLKAERVIIVGTLALPPLVPLPAPEQLAAYPSVALFVERARAVQPGFELTPGNAAAVAEICVRLDGLPLALELAAARVRLLAPAELLKRLSAQTAQSPLRLLRASARDAPARQQTLWQAIEWSEALLAPELRAAFARLSVFVGGCTAEAAAAVLNDEPGAAAGQPAPLDILDTLSELIDSSLLRQEIGSDGVPRFQMLETIRAFAREQLAARGETERLQQAHAAYYLSLAETAEPLLQGADQIAWLDRLEYEHDNMRAALAWCLEASAAHRPAADHLTPHPVEIGLRLGAALWPFWVYHGDIAEGGVWLQTILGLPAEAGPALARARVLNGAGFFKMRQSDLALATAQLEASLALCRQLGDARGSAWALNHLGYVALRQGDLERAARLQNQSLQLSRAIGSTWHSAWALSALGDVALHQGDGQRATAQLETSLALFQTIGDQHGIASTLQGLGEVVRGLGELERAAALFEECQRRFKQIGDADGVAIALGNLAGVTLAQGQAAAATAAYQESLVLRRTLGDKRGIAKCLEGLAEVALAHGQAERAVRLVSAAAALRHSVNPQSPFILSANRQARDQTIDAARELLSTDAFAAEWASGGILTLEQVIADALASSNAAATRARAVFAPAARLHNFPAQLTTFVGRQRELAEVAALLQHDDVRLLTLAGVGGMGKTRLALEAARARLGAFADGVVFVALAPLSKQASIPTAIAEAAGLQLPAGDPRQELLRALRDKRLLLLLDNFEHLINDAGLVAELLQAAPKLQILVTSREKLNIRSEHVYLVEGLDYTPNADLAATACPAVRLFVQSARRVQPGFRLHETQIEAVLRICQLVQGMPLGLELAASWAEQLPVDAIAAEIAGSADFLASDWRDIPERQRSIRAVFEWSWHLLTAEEQRSLRQLSIFRGGFTRVMAEAVAGASLRVLTRLVHTSLLRWSADGAAGRYQIHELLRQFAAEQLDAVPGERAAVEARHAEQFLAFVAQRETRLARAEPREAGAEIQRELDNIRQAWACAAEHGRFGELERSAYGLWLFYSLAGLLAEGEQAFRLASERVRASLAHADQAGDTSARGGQRVLSKLTALHASSVFARGRYEQALALSQAAVALGQSSGDVPGEVVGQLVWGQTLNRLSHFLEARPHLEEAIRLAHQHRDQAEATEIFNDSAALALVYLGAGSLMRGEYPQARALMLESLELCQRLHKTRGQLVCLCNLADIARETGDYVLAEQQYGQAFHLAQALRYRWAEGATQLELGNSARHLGNYARAHELYNQALAAFHEIGDDLKIAVTWVYCAYLHIHLGDYIRAREQLDHFLQSLHAIGPSDLEGEGCSALALLAYHTGDYEQALAYAERGTQLAQMISSRPNQADALLIKAHAQLALQRPLDAAAAFQQALEINQMLGREPIAAEARAGLAAVALVQGDTNRARAHVDDLLAVLARHTHPGLHEPFDIYLVCYCVLAATHDPRADDVARGAQQLLHAYAANIADDTLRHSFLNNVATHRELLRASATPALVGSGPLAPRAERASEDTLYSLACQRTTL